jgi:hypothetical protein
MLEKETPRRRILWQDLTEMSPDEIFRENTVLALKLTELPKSSDQIVFFQGRKDARMFRKKRVHASIKCY